MDPIETRYMRKQTAAFIKADGVEIALQHVTYALNTEGGRKESVVARDPQLVRIVPARSRSTSLTYTLPTGEVVSSKDLFLLGPFNLEVEMEDFFTWQDRAYRISYIEPDRTYQTLCQVDEMGDDERSTL